MFSAFKRANLWLLIVAFFVGVLTAPLFGPLYKRALIYGWQENFAALTFKCDQSMREHYLAKQKVSLNVNDETVGELKAAEIGLIDCQDYDLFQKKMKRWGLTDNEVGEMVLKAAEDNKNGMRKVIEIHEIQY